MERKDLAFTKVNYILVGISLLLIVVGFVLMSGSGTTDQAFNPDIFSKTRIEVAPFVVLMGFLLIIFAILYKKKEN